MGRWVLLEFLMVPNGFSTCSQCVPEHDPNNTNVAKVLKIFSSIIEVSFKYPYINILTYRVE
jgi:hypothetical protein